MRRLRAVVWRGICARAFATPSAQGAARAPGARWGFLFQSRVRAESGREWLVALLGLAALLLIQLLCVPPTNFGGLDEWLDLELVSRGVVAVPFAYRPLGLIWASPASWLVPGFGFAAFRWLFGLYALLSAVVSFGLVRRLLPERPSLGMLTACFVLAWAPRDMARLSTVDSVNYQGITLGTLLAVALLVEAWQRRSRALFGASVLMAFLAIRCYEGGCVLLAFAPALLLLTQERSRRLWGWTLVWESVVGMAAAFVLLELEVSARETSYQLSVMQLDPDPLGWVGRLARQYSLHLSPLFTSAPSELWARAVAVAVIVVVLSLAAVGRNSSRDWQGRWLLWVAGSLGLVLAGSAYSLVLLGWQPPTAYRLQFLSGPGIALFLASVVHLLGSLLRGRERLATAVLGASVVAVGTGRTLAMQREWEAISVQPRQMRMLSELIRVVPDVDPHTLLIALDEGGAWFGSFPFHHAVQYLFERRAAGFVPRRTDTLYRASAVPKGIQFEPLPIVHRAWDAPRTVYGYDEIVVVRNTPREGVVVLDDWPADLKALPPGVRYAPRNRIHTHGPLKRAAILAQE